MSISLFLVLLVFGVLAITFLLKTIRSQLKKEKDRASFERETNSKKQEARGKIIESIHILLKVVGSEELGWIETSIRVKNLLDQLSIDLSEHDSIGVFYKVYAETEHIPTHEGWSILPKSAKNAFRKTLAKCESKYASELEQGKKDLLAYPLI